MEQLRTWMRSDASSGDNGEMANALGSSRLDPRQMVAGVVGDSFGRWTLRLAFGMIAGCVVLDILAPSLGYWSFMPAAVAVLLAVWRVNGRRLLQIPSEVGNLKSVSMSQAVSSLELVEAVNIAPGDWVCPKTQYEKIYTDAELRHRESRELAEKRRAASNQGDLSTGDSTHAPMKDPEVPLQWVIATKERTGEDRLVLTLASLDTNRPRTGDMYYRHRPQWRSPAAVEVAGKALTDLLRILDMGPKSEQSLLGELATMYSESAVHRALRAAIAYGFISQEVGPKRFFWEPCSIFSSRIDEKFRWMCALKLSKVGQSWIQAGASSQHNSDDSYYGEGPPSSGATYIFNTNPTFNSISSMKSAEYFYGNQSEDRHVRSERRSASVGPRLESHKNESTERTIAWSAGVSAAGAGLAALFTTSAAVWQHALFVSLVFVSSAAFLVLICTGIPDLFNRLQNRRRKSSTTVTDSDDDPINPSRN